MTASDTEEPVNPFASPRAEVGWADVGVKKSLGLVMTDTTR
jgi:hypothetical protein